MYISSLEAKQKISSLGDLTPVETENSTEKVYRLPEAKGSIGFISPVSEPFCGWCDRIRLTADGRLRACLCAEDSVDLAALLRRGASDAEILEYARGALACKPARGAASTARPAAESMAGVGG